MDLEEGQEVVTAAVRVVVIMAVVTAAVMVVVITAAVMVVVIPSLITLTIINLPEQMVGKTEVMEILLKMLHLKVVGAGEKGEFPMT